MANWTGFSMTSRGAELQAKVNAGSTTLTFTKLALGSGEAEGSLENLTELVHKEMDMTIKSISNEGNIVTLRSTITNKGISQAFYAREMGLYATDPDLGEILYAIQTDPKPDNIPVEGSATVVSEDFTAHLIMSNTGSVSAVLDTGALLTLEDLRNHEADETAHEAAFDKHNKEENAHSGILQKISTLGDDIIKKLALTTTIAAISALQTNSWFGQLLKMVLTASGVKYNIEQNGYICLGSFFGGLIIQWGITGFVSNASSPQAVTLPMSYTEKHLTTVAVNHTSTMSLTDDMAGRHIVCTVIGSFTLTGFSVSFVNTPSRVVSFISVGK